MTVNTYCYVRRSTLTATGWRSTLLQVGGEHLLLEVGGQHLLLQVGGQHLLLQAGGQHLLLQAGGQHLQSYSHRLPSFQQEVCAFSVGASRLEASLRYLSPCAATSSTTHWSGTRQCHAERKRVVENMHVIAERVNNKTLFCCHKINTHPTIQTAICDIHRLIGP